jgi:hypothetical protein
MRQPAAALESRLKAQGQKIRTEGASKLAHSKDFALYLDL